MLGRLITGSHPKWTTPKELGISYFKEINKIYIGDCGAPKNDLHYGISWGISGTGAHTHKCPKEKIYQSVCFSHGEEILNYDGTPSDALWHEYGHILDNMVLSLRNWTCVSPISYHKYDIYTVESAWDSHGNQWREIMRLLGRPDINSLWVNPSIKAAQAAAAVIR